MGNKSFEKVWKNIISGQTKNSGKIMSYGKARFRLASSETLWALLAGLHFAFEFIPPQSMPCGWKLSSKKYKMMTMSKKKFSDKIRCYDPCLYKLTTPGMP